jgi:hypothetical protein
MIIIELCVGKNSKIGCGFTRYFRQSPPNIRFFAAIAFLIPLILAPVIPFSACISRRVDLAAVFPQESSQFLE